MTRDDVLGLLTRRVAAVMAVDPERIGPETRFDEDLHADSLDLVEIVEGVERELRGHGVKVRLADGALPGLATVGDVADRIVEAT